jgi:uncharacterized membrane protein
MTYSDYRRVARENLRGNWPLSIGVCAIACILGGMSVGGSFIPEFSFRIDGQDISNINDLLNLITPAAFSAFGLGSLLALTSLVIGGTIELGFAQYLLKQYNHANFALHDLFSRFDRFGQGFAQKFLRGLYTILWSFLFIIPGIVKSYAYAMTPFIMAENPELSANEAIAASEELMDGHKGELFTLDLTFLGWSILAILSFNLGHLALNPYRNAAYAAFYKDLTANK